MTEQTAFEVLRASPLARELNEQEIGVLARLIEIHDLKDGELLLEEGRRDSTLHVVVAGAVNVAKHGEEGRWNTLHTLTQGDLVGELSFMDDEPRSASLVASGQTRVFSLRREQLETLLDTHPRIVYRTMRAIMRVVHAIQRRLTMQMVQLQNYIYKTHGRY